MISRGGIQVHVTAALPTYPSDVTNIRRFVRHGFADVLSWLGEDIGPEPGEPTHAFISVDPAGGDPVLFVSPERFGELRRAVQEVV